MTQKILTKIYSLYRITNKINGKNYIGQTVNLSKRWSDHRRAVRDNKPTQIIHHAMIKYGIDNFEFVELGCSLNQEDTNEAETLLVEQYNSFVINNYGYNCTYGGYNAPKSEAWFESMEKWRSSLSEAEKQEIRNKQSKATIQQIAEKGHPALGHQWTEEQKLNLSNTLKALDKEAIYTEEVRQKMSESHLGKKQPQELIDKRVESIKATCAKRDYTEIKCAVPGCEVQGKKKYRIIDNIRYCNKHGHRMSRYGRIERIR